MVNHLGSSTVTKQKSLQNVLGKVEQSICISCRTTASWTSANCCLSNPQCVSLNTYALQVTSAVTTNLISVSLCLHLSLSTTFAPGLRMHSG